jgi:hypothetical protein
LAWYNYNILSNKEVINLSLSDIVIKIIGVILAIAGLILILSAVGVNLLGSAVGIGNPLLNIVIGVLLLGAGIFIIRGGNITA